MSQHAFHNRLALPSAVAVALIAGCGRPQPAQPVASAPPQAPAAATTPARSPAPSAATAAAATPAPAAAPAAAGPALLSFDHDAHDFGTVSDIRPVSHEYPFTNSGSGTLTISGVSTSCGCTTAKATKTELAPGESGTIEVTYSPRGYGQHTYWVTVVSNAAQQPDARVQFTAEVDPFVSIEPRQVDFGTVDLNQERQAFVTLACSDPDMEVSSIALRTEEMTARVTDRADVGAPPSPQRPGRAVIEVTLAKNAPWGEVRGTIVAVLQATPPGESTPIEHTVYVPVNVLLFGAVHADPSSFHLGVIKPGETFASSLKLTQPAGTPFQIESAAVEESNVSGLTVKLEPLAEAGASGYTMTLSGDLGQHTGPVHGYVAFATDIPGMPPKCRIRFSGIVRE